VNAKSVTIDSGSSSFVLTGGTLIVENELNIEGGALNAGGTADGLIVSNGGNVNGGGAVTLGANTQWLSEFTQRRDFSVYSGNVTVQDGASISVDSGTTAVGRGLGNVGSVLVTGLGSEFSNSGQHGEFLVGFEGGSGQLNVQNGGQVFSGNPLIGGSATIGYGVGSTGQVTVSGAGSNWTSGGVGVGYLNGTGILTVEDHGSLNTSYLGVRAGSSVTVDNASIDATQGGERRVELVDGGSLQASNNSNVNVNHVSIDGAGSKATFDHSTLTAESLDLTNGAFFKATLSTINITGNTTTIDATSQMILNGGTYDEAGDFIIYEKLTGTNPIINIGSDLIINNGGSVEFSGLASLLIGDDLLFFGDPGTSYLGLTTITMQGLLDDDSNGFQFDLGSAFLGTLNLGKLIVDAVELILTGNFNISELILPGTATIRLADNSTLTVNRFTGDENSITGGTFHNNTPAVPEPTTLLLFGMGLLGLLGFRRFRKIG